MYKQYKCILGKGQAKCNADDDNVAVRSLTKRAEGAGHKLYVDSSFSSPDLSDNPYKRYRLSDKIIKECQVAFTRRH
jgi:hypothetical protein